MESVLQGCMHSWSYRETFSCSLAKSNSAARLSNHHNHYAVISRTFLPQFGLVEANMSKTEELQGQTARPITDATIKH